MFLDRSKFKFSSDIVVRNYEVDWQGIVHNAVYLLYFETGRIEYLQQLGVPINLEAIRKESKIVVARNEIDYRWPARFGESLRILTRISAVKNTSFNFEGIILEKTTERIIAENSSVHVWLDQVTGQPVTVAPWFRQVVRDFEGENADVGMPASPQRWRFWRKYHNMMVDFDLKDLRRPPGRRGYGG
jgi:acyl-CoA thioester hydrolase